VWSLVAGAATLVLVRRMPPGLVLRAIGARAVSRSDGPALYDMLDALCQRAGLERAPLLCWVGERAPVAFTVGQGEATTIVLSAALLPGMTRREIQGILAHEIVHVRNGDIALMQLAMVAGRLTRLLSQIGLLLIFLSLFLRVVAVHTIPIPPLMILVVAPIAVSMLQLALSRAREGEADLEAAELTGDPHALASALVKMRRHEQMLLRGGFPTVAPIRIPSLLRDFIRQPISVFALCCLCGSHPASTPWTTMRCNSPPTMRPRGRGVGVAGSIGSGYDFSARRDEDFI